MKSVQCLAPSEHGVGVARFIRHDLENTILHSTLPEYRQRIAQLDRKIAFHQRFVKTCYVEAPKPVTLEKPDLLFERVRARQVPSSER